MPSRKGVIILSVLLLWTIVSSAVLASVLSCGERYWNQFGKDKKLLRWISTPDQNFLELRFGYTFVVSSENPYPPCEMRLAERPYFTEKRNTLIVAKNGEEVYRKEWYGGLITQVQFLSYNDGSVEVRTCELLYDVWVRSDIKDKKSACVFSIQWRSTWRER